MGHALAALRCKNIDPVHRVSIVPRGAAALGMTMVRPLEDRHIMTKSELEDRMTFALGGRSAEEIVFGDLSTGAADDLHRATDIARAMIVDYGMSKKLGPAAFGQNGRAERMMLFPGEGPQLAAGTAQTIDEEIRELVDQSRDRAMATLKDDRDLLDRLSEVLIAREVIDGDELRRWVDGEQPIPTIEELQVELDERRANDQDAASRPEAATADQVPTQPLPTNGDDPSAGRERVTLTGDSTPPRPD
jgi:cell division protease FtsH